ncbi:riboflavin kinase [Spiroplasma diminutum]|uniref:riboflavin kinase n=1 Tax=Spiroplasma diminutum CUAS-1 TaxID=1276221 RepID=S5LZU7_9MOLU|nr:riboflavin kinase [Spiroplasma diminutum]AGR42131.1 riboflavin kinase/FAD synthetase [Spiroplasma diminutum CUAS-1]
MMKNNTITFFYNNMTMIMLHLENSVGLIADFENWSEKEDKQINNLKEIARESNLKTTLFVLSTREMNFGLWNAENIIEKAQNNEIDYVVFYQWNPMMDHMSDLDIYQNMQSFLNIKKVIIANDFVNKEALRFSCEFISNNWKENAILINSQEGNDLKENLLLLNQSNFKEFENKNKLAYKFNSRVNEGKKLGRTIGFPTINLITEEKLPLTYGVYACYVYIDHLEKTFIGSGCYWTNELNQDVFEIFLTDFDQEIYDWKVIVTPVEKLRDNVKVNSLDELKELLRKDIENTLKVLK